MGRTQRVLALIALLRSHRYPVSGQTLADKLEVSVRTLYRDIATLQEQGANIQGEAGVGYVLKPGFLLPPLMFTEEEIEALILNFQNKIESFFDYLMGLFEYSNELLM